MKKILWAAAHPILEAQREELRNLYGEDVQIDILKNNDLDMPNIFDSPKDATSLCNLAERFLFKVKEHQYDIVVQPAGSPAFQFALGVASYNKEKIKILYAHSERKIIEEENEDGTIIKKSMFEHSHFISFVF